MMDYGPHILRALALLRDDPLLDRLVVCRSERRRRPRYALMQELDDASPEGMPRVFLGWWRCKGDEEGGGQPRLDLTRALQHLLTAGLVVIAGLGCRTASEALQLKVGCVSQPETGLYELAVRIIDGVRDLDAMPVPPLVAYAVEILCRLTAATRKATGGDEKLSVGFPPDGYLRDFAAINGLPATDPETGTPLDIAQLELGFAMAYFHVPRALPLEALSRALGQFDFRNYTGLRRAPLAGRCRARRGDNQGPGRGAPERPW